MEEVNDYPFEYWKYKVRIQKLNEDGTYDVHGRNPHLKCQYGTDRCCTLHVRKENLEYAEDDMP